MASITRNFKNIKALVSQDEMVTNYNNMLNKVTNMIEKQGPIYSVWISFQVGINNPIIFNTASTDLKQNLIAELTVEKNGAGVANSFILKVNYDPFNHGQNPSDKIEALDALVAEILSYDFGEDVDPNKQLRGYIQYGYNYTEDENLISPKYQFIITKASSVVQWSSGMTVYTFEGVSEVAPSCNIEASFEAVENRNLISLVKDTLYYYYGDPDNPPYGIEQGRETINGDTKYLIDVTEEMERDAPEITWNAVNKASPMQYCETVLKDQMSKSDKEKLEQKYEETGEEIKTYEKPRYIIYLTDTDGNKTIHIAYINPTDTENNLKIDYKFSWNLQSKNIVLEWNPETDLFFYLVQQYQINYENRMYEQKLKTATDNENKEEITKEYESKMGTLSDQAFEMYNATLTIVGIPADPPLASEVQIIPRILESTSRTQGVYMINGCTDNITTKGAYSSQLKVTRVRSL